ncbi:MAG: 2-amino-4-hydroxy-6-hydroxymethyldihydropteridine diphosphokinase [Pseudomonadales bacterium]
MTLETTDKQVTCYIGIGANLSEPIAQVETAIKKLQSLPHSTWIGASPLFSTAPVGPQDQPDYINAVAVLSTELEAHSLLDQLQAIENEHLRVRERHWGPRTLDLDILLYGDAKIATARLNVPHPYMTERSFVLAPLATLAPDLNVNNQTVLQWLEQCPSGGIQQL